MTARSKPNTLALIRRGRGLLKRQPGAKSFAVEWADVKKREKDLENRLARIVPEPRSGDRK